MIYLFISYLQMDIKSVIRFFADKKYVVMNMSLYNLESKNVFIFVFKKCTQVELLGHSMGKFLILLYIY